MTERERCPECRYGGGWHAEWCQTHGESDHFVSLVRICIRLLDAVEAGTGLEFDADEVKTITREFFMAGTIPTPVSVRNTNNKEEQE